MRRFRILICAVLAGLIVLLAAVPGARIKQSGAPDQEQAASESAGPEQSTEPAPTAETTAAAGPEQEGYLQVPRYFQTDYPYIKFGNGTIATSGCSITCLAMVATYLTDHEYTPRPDGLPLWKLRKDQHRAFGARQRRNAAAL